jgi:hypothetical protein
MTDFEFKHYFDMSDNYCIYINRLLMGHKYSINNILINKGVKLDISRIRNFTGKMVNELYIDDKGEKQGWESGDSNGGIKWYNCLYKENNELKFIKIGYDYHIHNKIDLYDNNKNIEYFWNCK